MSDTYYDSAESVMISQERAFQELTNHCCQEFEEFLVDMGDKEEYSAQAVLEWLGY